MGPTKMRSTHLHIIKSVMCVCMCGVIGVVAGFHVCVSSKYKWNFCQCLQPATAVLPMKRPHENCLVECLTPNCWGRCPGGVIKRLAIFLWLWPAQAARNGRHGEQLVFTHVQGNYAWDAVVPHITDPSPANDIDADFSTLVDINFCS